MRAFRIPRVFCVALCAALGLAPLGAQSLSRHPYVQMTTRDSAVVVWRTVGATLPVVRYGTALDQLDREVSPVQMVVRSGPDVASPPGQPKLHSAPAGTFQYEAYAFSLVPGTTYYYAVFDGDDLLAGGADHHFTTSPGAAGAPTRLWVVGDSGDGSAAQVAAFDAMRTLTAEEGKGIDAFLHLGDMAYGSGTDLQFGGRFFGIYSALLRNTVTWPTMGNHEGFTSSGLTGGGPYYDAYVLPTGGEAGGVPSGSEAFYSFDIGSAHFVCLDSYDLDRSPAGEMALWLKADLEATTADWLIAFWHHPPYTKGTHDSDREIELIEMREFIMPMLESSGVDLVLTGHSHIYERSMLIDGAYVTPTTSDGVVLDDGDGRPDGDGAYAKSASLNPHEGTVQVVAGNGRSAFNFAFSPVMRTTLREVGSLLIDIDGDTLTGRMLNTEGAVSDTFQLVKTGAVVPQIIEYPWGPHGPGALTERLEPGSDFVQFFPSTGAPDAAQHYTLDGSEPTLASPVAAGPIAVPTGGGAQAITVWRGGARSSPTSTTVPLPSYLSVHRYPAAAGDDAFEYPVSSMVLDSPALDFRDGNVVGLRYTDVRIPEGAYIVSAEIQFSKAAASPEYTATQTQVRGEFAGASAPFTAGFNDLTGRVMTQAVVPWTVRAWTGINRRDTNSSTPDLREILAEVIAHPGWQSGNPMSFLFTEIVGQRTAAAFEEGRQEAAALSVVFVDPDGLAQRLASQPLGHSSLPNGLLLSMRWPTEPIAGALGLSYTVEASDDLFSWDVVVPDGVNIPLGASLSGFGTLSFTFSPDFMAARERVYFRVRVTGGAAG